MSTNEGYRRALDLLRCALTPAGFLASAHDVANYRRIWARDSVIAGLAALTTGDHELHAGLRRTLDTLAGHQGPHGEIPSNVGEEGKQVSYGGRVGRVDAPLWYVIGVCRYALRTGDEAFAARHRPAIDRALFLAGCWEFNNRGLLYVPLSGDWADEYIQHGYALSEQVLYLMALEDYGRVFGSDVHREKAVRLREQIAVNYWLEAQNAGHPLLYHPRAYRSLCDSASLPGHWLATFTPAGYARRFDGLANALALLAGLGDEATTAQTIAYVESLCTALGSDLLPAFYPPIEPGASGWDGLRLNHAGRFRNFPYAYHNGGLWPVWTGIWVAALARWGEEKRAARHCAAIHRANALGLGDERWGFYEFHHGQTHRPMGTPHATWSAAGAVIAHNRVGAMHPAATSPSREPAVVKPHDHCSTDLAR